MKNKRTSFITISSLLFVMSLAACASNPIKNNSKSGESQNDPSSAVPDFEVNFALKSVDEPFETYNETQKGYMRDTYDKISSYGSGNKENSKPNKLNVSWEIIDPELELTNIRLDLTELNQDRNTISYLLDKDATSYDLNNLKVDTHYVWTITAIAGDKEVTSPKAQFTTMDNQVRFIDIDGLSNVRDCGGWTGLDGRKIKQGLLYRGEEFNQQNNGRKGSGSTATTDTSVVDPDEDVERAKAKPYGKKITDKGIDTVLNELKLKTECDVRGYETFDWETRVNEAPTECGGLKNGRGLILDINYVINPVHTSRDKIYYDSYGKAAVKGFFSLLADKETHLPLYFHCAQGKDRTGFLAYLFEGFMGCSYDDMMRDYLLSNLGKTGSVSVSKLVGSSANYNYVDYFNGLEVNTQDGVKYQATGDSIAERAYNYLLSCGLTENQLDTIRETFLEPEDYNDVEL